MSESRDFDRNESRKGAAAQRVAGVRDSTQTSSGDLVKRSSLVDWNGIARDIDAARDIDTLEKLRFQIGSIQGVMEAAKRLRGQREKAILALNKCQEYLVQIDRKLCEWMQEHITQGGTPESHETTLAQINCTKSEHQRLKMLASIPQDRIDEYFRQANEVVREASRSGVLHLYSVPPQPSPPLPAGKFRVILSDNPWEYEHTPGRINPPEAHYPTMSTEEMCAMGDKISALAAKDCTLFMWVPPCKLPEGLKVLAAWGFEWVTQKVWDKGGRNMGPYGNVVHENLLIGKRGSGTPTTTNKKLIQSFDSIQRCPKTRTHSQKPVTYHEMIEKLWPGQKYIELFAREPEHRRKGWKYWGNELEDLLSGSSPGGTRTRNNQPLHVVRPAKVVPFRNDLARTKAASG